MAINIRLSESIANVFDDIMHDMGSFGSYIRFRGVYGGRGSGKTLQFASMTTAVALAFSATGRKGNILCAREYMNSLSDSSLEEIKTAIYNNNMGYYFDVGEKYVRTADKRVTYLFAGLNRNINSLKSKSNIILSWIDEAEPVSEMAWSKLIPTVRADRSEIWITWNPEDEDSATDRRFRKGNPKHSKIAEVNYHQNPWFPEVLEKSRLSDQENLDPATYAWIWEGAYRVESDAQILNGKVDVREFEPADSWQGPYYGLDWGFSQDPTAAVKCWVYDGCLYVEYEAGKIGLELDDTAEFMIGKLPGIERHVVRSDSARPESISYVRRNGLKHCKAVEKWPGSVEDGIAHLRSYRRIIVHPRCKQTIRETRLYSYKVDRNSGDVLPVIVDANNHYLDACIAKGELVSTLRGNIPIEYVLIGDVVMTRLGWKKVLHHQITKKDSEVIEIISASGLKLKCTTNHLVYCVNKNTFLRADSIEYGDIIMTFKREGMPWSKQLFTTARFTEDILEAKEDLIEFILNHLPGARFLYTFTGKYGSIILGKFQKASTCITSMKTRGTTALRTLNACLLKIISANIRRAKTQGVGGLSILKESGILQKNGTQAPKVLSFTKRLVGWLTKTFCQLKSYASNVARVFSQNKSVTEIYSAQTHANQRGGGILELTILQKIASRVAVSSFLINTKKSDFVADRVVKIRQVAESHDVYDIMVEDAEEFFASGILVHNCRYALQPMIRKRSSFFG